MTGTSNRGFASMDPEKQKEIASKGGKAAHEKGTAHQFTSEEARRAGSKGGRAARQKRVDAQEQKNTPNATTERPNLVLHKEDNPRPTSQVNRPQVERLDIGRPEEQPFIDDAVPPEVSNG